MSTLIETQSLLWALITAPEGVAPALAADAANGGSLRDRLGSTVRGDACLSAVDRLDIYANMYFFRLLDVIKDDYPAVAAAVGEAAFHNLITDYLLVHFPAHPSLRHAGEHVPAFLAEHHLVRDLPFLAELAEFEWSLVDAFDAPDSPALQRQALATVPADAWGELRFTLRPSVVLRTYRWPVHDLRQRAVRGSLSDGRAPASTPLCVWRNGFQVLHREFEPDESGALTAVAEREPFSVVCSLVADSTGDNSAPARVFGMLGRWISDGLIEKVEIGGG